MNTNENVKKDVVNEQKNLIAKSVKELKTFFKNIKVEFDEKFNYKVYQLTNKTSKFIDVSVSMHSISATVMTYILTCELIFTRLFYIDFEDSLIIFNYEILNWSD